MKPCPSQMNEVYLAALPPAGAPALLSALRRCQGFRVRAACESGAARLSYSIARHGGGSTTRVDFLSPFFLELWGYSGWTRLLHQVITPSRKTARVISFRLWLEQSLGVIMNDFSLSQQRRSQEYNLAASSEWRSGNNRAQKNSR